MTCPCGGPSYDACCGPLHTGATAATAEQLMRSRYSAFAVGDAAYLVRTWDPTTRPRRLVLDRTRWTRLEVVGSAAGGLFDTTGTVHFRAHHDSGVIEELSTFARSDRIWFYVAGRRPGRDGETSR